MNGGYGDVSIYLTPDYGCVRQTDAGCGQPVTIEKTSFAHAFLEFSLMTPFRRSVTNSVVLLMMAPVAFSDELRTWKDSSGSFSVEAEFVSKDLTSVTLRTSGGREIAVPLAKLSREDRQYLDQLKPRKLDRQKVQPSPPHSLHDRLAKTADFQYSQTPLTEVLEAFKYDHSLPTLLDKRSLEESGINIATSVSYSKSNVSVGDAFSELLDSIALEWTINHGVVVVTTREGAEARLSTCVYRMKGGANSAALVEDIRKSIDPNSWDSMGGPASIIAFPPHSLIVNQRQTVHQQIANKHASTLTLVPHRPISFSALQVNIPVESLTKPLTLEISNRPLRDLAPLMAESAKTKTTFDEQALRKIGLSLDTPITMNLPELPLIDAAFLALESLSLTLSIQSNEIVITTLESAETNLIPAIYKTGALNQNLLQSVLFKTASPDSWNAIGGPGTVNADQRGTLDVRQTLGVHLQIAQLLSDL